MVRSSEFINRIQQNIYGGFHFSFRITLHNHKLVWKILLCIKKTLVPESGSSVTITILMQTTPQIPNHGVGYWHRKTNWILCSNPNSMFMFQPVGHHYILCHASGEVMKCMNSSSINGSIFNKNDSPRLNSSGWDDKAAFTRFSKLYPNAILHTSNRLIELWQKEMCSTPIDPSVL